MKYRETFYGHHTTLSNTQNDMFFLSRILASDENVYHSQSEWKTNGRFVLVDRDMVQLDQDVPVSWYISIFKLISLKME